LFQRFFSDAIHLLDFGNRVAGGFLLCQFLFDFRFQFFCKFLFFDEFSGSAEDGAGSEIAEPRMSDHSFDGRGVGFGLTGFGQIEAGNLETIKEQASAFRMHASTGDALQDF